ncbi:uncharacterized protein YlxW (UPF0749 family) [Krasilnikovia cinnamomea]|uniref:Uncharacterized protein YlxW (UPF0749 family) n=1 Tax=Krasilnikovia cinnamomea TaxID=349313 RepID=A0A4Q7ZCL9_9ACTN|nr:DUF881 domain-containing protein [Krasilnikovia cinnamomea]RZU48407.1 uncharacterized protein YlxW (UPF0749 family) [Krasilnikovia cinnamomea]
MSDQHRPRPADPAQDTARDDEPTVVTPRDEPGVPTPGDEPTVVTPRDEPGAPTPGDEPTVVTSRDESTVVTPGDESTVVASGDEPTVATRREEPFAAAAEDEPVVAGGDEPAAVMSRDRVGAASASADRAPIAAPEAQPTAVSLDPVEVDRMASAPDAAGAEGTGAEGAGADSAGTESTGTESTGTESTGTESTGTESTGTESAGAGDAGAVPARRPAPWRRVSSAGALIWVLLALFGFTLVVQLRSNGSDEGLATARQEDLVRILSDLEARDTRLQAEINALEQSQRQLTSGVAGRQAALAEADKRADELGLLAGTLPGRGPGLRITIDPKGQGVKASAILNAVQELRGAGGEVMELAGAGGAPVRIVAGSYFVDSDGGGITVDGVRLTGPYTLSVIGVPQTMQTALQIPGGVVASVEGAGGSVTMEQRAMVEVTAVRKATNLQYARPVS